MRIEKFIAKSLIREARPSLFSWAEIYLNPYQGCYHDCKYCDGKSEGYYMHEDYADRIRVKINAPTLLEQFLKKKGFVPIRGERTSTLVDYLPSLKGQADFHNKAPFILYIGGGVCDVYQPAERKVRITQKLLQIAHDYSFPVMVLTKNKSVLRDLDLLKKINEDNYACVNFTITLSEEKMQKIFEPRASTTQERFRAIKKLREEGIHSGVYFYPTLPFIGDTDENMEAIYNQAKAVDAEFVYCWGLTLKPGRSKNEFLQTIEKNLPSFLPKYRKLYANNDKYGNLDEKQFKKMDLVWPEVKGFKLGYERGLGYTAEHYIPEGRIKINLQISEVLFKIAYIKAHILRNSKTEVRELHQTAMFLNTFQQDVSKLKVEEFKKLPIARSVHPLISEFIKEGKSGYLEKLEDEAYNVISK